MSQVKTPNIIICVVTRMTSSRLPGKALVDIAGRPFISRLIERVSASRHAAQVVLCTSTDPEDDPLVELCEQSGTAFYRGSLLDVLSRFIGAAEEFGAEHVVRVTGDNIFTDPLQIDRLIEAHLKYKSDYSRIDNLPLGVASEVMRVEMCKAVHKTVDDRNQTEYTQLFTYVPDRHKCLVLDAPEALRRPNYSLTTDTMNDVEQVRRIFAAFPDHENGPPLDVLVPWMDKHQDSIIQIPDSFPIKVPSGTVTWKAYKKMMDEKRQAANAAFPNLDLSAA